MTKRVAVLFSSGLDSTYLVWKNLKDDNTVIPIYIEIQNNVKKTIMEKNRIELLMKEFKLEFNTEEHNRMIQSVEYAISVNVNAYEGTLYFKQVPIWMFGVVFLQSLDVDEIQIGYVSNDDAIPYLNDIKKIYKSYQSICEKMIPLTFPLSKMKKWQMVKELPKKYLDLIFTCENPHIIDSTKENEKIEYKPCCDCTPCRTIISTDYYETGDFPEYYKEKILDKKVNDLHRYGYRVIDGKGNDYEKKYEVYAPSLMSKKSDSFTKEFDRVSVSVEKSHVLVGSENYIKKNIWIN